MASLMTEQSGSDDDKVDQDFLVLLNEFKESKDKEKAAAELKASLPVMERQRSAPLWDQMLNPGKDGKVDPNKFFSKSKNTPFDGILVEGKNIMTFVRGRLVFSN